MCQYHCRSYQSGWTGSSKSFRNRTISGHPAFGDKFYQFIHLLGKGNCINSRLKSHKEIEANDKAEAWSQFFCENFKSGLTAYFLIIDKISKPNTENAKKAIERIVQIKYEPRFDRMY